MGPSTQRKAIQPRKRDKVDPASIDVTKSVELAVLAVRGVNARCLLSGTDREITLRSGDLWDIVPGEVVHVGPQKVWSYFRHTYLSGTIMRHQIDLEVFKLAPLALTDCGMWEPKEHYWGEEGEALEDWAIPIYEGGPRPEFEMEQVIPGDDPDDPDADPISEAVALYEGGSMEDAGSLLMDILQVDFRCLDAHAHLGNFAFDPRPEPALRHYKVGVLIGELSLGSDFRGLLPWSLIDNRPFLRCLHGYALCLWRLGRFEEAQKTLERMLWLNPSDNQGGRFLLSDVRERSPWAPEE